MAERTEHMILVRGAEAHNLQGFDVEIPRRSLTVITGVSGSGKSSLAFDTLFREGQRRFLETLPAFARHFVGGLGRPAARSIEGLGPAVALGQRSSQANPRSTVGTLTEGWDLLRLLFARLGTGPGGVQPSRGLFSFNGAEGACPRCQGLGVEDCLDLDLLVADPAKSLRAGALHVSTPNGYLMYSQVTLAVLDEVLHAHGGSVDIPWQELSDEVRRVVLYGSERLKVPYGKHPLESRLKWTGITARPRQDGFYRGLVPVMEEILRGKRNDSILRFVQTGPCSACGGARLRPEALAVTWRGRRIVDLAALSVGELREALLAPDAAVVSAAAEAAVLAPIRDELLARCNLMLELGLGYLSLDRPAPSLSRGEAQRLRLLGLALGELRGLLLVLDEPTAGLHPSEVGPLIRVLQRLRDQGQTVVVVEHEARLVRAADWLIDLGPGPGPAGGQLLWSGPPSDLLGLPLGADATPTQLWLAGTQAKPTPAPRLERGTIGFQGLHRHNLQHLDVELALGALNVVTGRSGSGKTSLLDEVVACCRAQADSPFHRIVTVDAEPIGRTPRSNAATYTGAFDLIRDLFAASPEAKARGFGKGHFTFNTAGGRCEACEGAGVVEVGMRHLGSVDLICETCAGRRFHPEVLAVQLRGRSVADLLEGSIAEAAEFFAGNPRLRRILTALLDVGLGYLPLGQPATTLSGGEAQRVKLATELAKTGSGPALIALDEPSTGLHAADVDVLLGAWDRLLDAGHTLLVADHDLQIIRHADLVLDLGPGGGPEGGRLVAAGSPQNIAACAASATGVALREGPSPLPPSRVVATAPTIELEGVRTHNLRAIDVRLPATGLTVVTGPSGSGKSSLVFDTLLAEAQARFADLVSPWARRLLPKGGGADFDAARGLQATLALPQRAGRRNPRASVGSATELDALLRLLYARAGERPVATPAQPELWAADFSVHSERGACPACKGLGFLQRCDPERLVSHPEKALAGGAMDGSRFGAYLGEAHGQFVATLRQAAATAGLNLGRPWRDLGPAERDLAMRGSGEVIHEVAWAYQRGKAEGVHHLATPWVGFATLVEREYERVHADAKGEELEALLVDLPCPACAGEGLRDLPRSVSFGGLRLPELRALPVGAALAWCAGLEQTLSARLLQLTAGLRQDLLLRLRALEEAGLSYLAIQRELASLSGGEAQRVRLAAALGGGLVGVTYVLDEPSRGLHPRDVARLGGVLRRLAEQSAVVIVEHEAALIAAADQVLELGPGAGPEGGRLLAMGSPADLTAQSESRVGALLRRPRRVSTMQAHCVGGLDVRVRGAHLHNLNQFDVAFPIGALVTVTGVSGSGKSSLVLEVLAPSLRNHLQGRVPVGCAGLELAAGIEFTQVLSADQAALGTAWNSSVLSLTGLGDSLRKRFAATPQAKALKLRATAFSTATSGGRCEACEGRGLRVVAMDLLPDVTVGCETCGGRRFRPEVLGCLLDGRSIADLLEASVAELAGVFAADRTLAKPLGALMDVGLGYLRLGQEGANLSEGELQRLRLADLLADPLAGRAAILLDEPTRGLGFEDLDRLAAQLHRLAQAGHLVVAVTHDLDLIQASDWIIDLGPEGGEAGGWIVVEGTPETVRACAVSYTGQALAQLGE